MYLSKKKAPAQSEPATERTLVSDGSPLEAFQMQFIGLITFLPLFVFLFL